jgi:hypothetical protein
MCEVNRNSDTAKYGNGTESERQETHQRVYQEYSKHTLKGSEDKDILSHTEPTYEADREKLNISQSIYKTLININTMIQMNHVITIHDTRFLCSEYVTTKLFKSTNFQN